MPYLLKQVTVVIVWITREDLNSFKHKSCAIFLCHCLYFTVVLIHCDLFKIYCAPQNLGITRTWICRLNFAQRPIFFRLGVLYRAWYLRLWTPRLKSLSEDLCSGFLRPKKIHWPQPDLNREPWIASTLPRDHRGRHHCLLLWIQLQLFLTSIVTLIQWNENINHNTNTSYFQIAQHHNQRITEQNNIPLTVYHHIINSTKPLERSPHWSSGQRVWLLIMRSRVWSPALPQILNVD